MKRLKEIEQEITQWKKYTKHCYQSDIVRIVTIINQKLNTILFLKGTKTKQKYFELSDKSQKLLLGKLKDELSKTAIH